MLKVNNVPVVSGGDLENKIVLTDTAYSDLSVVHLPKQHAPLKNQFVWVTINDPHYNSSDPYASEFMFARWMFVDQVLFLEYVDPYVRDENGEVTRDEEDRPIRRSMRDHEGIVKVILRETKHTLSLVTNVNDYNIPGKLPLVMYASATQYLGGFASYNATAFPFRNQITLEEIADKFSTMGSRFEYAEGDMPPDQPFNLFWHGKNLAQCLDDLLQSYSCRVIEDHFLTPDSSAVRDYDHYRFGMDDYNLPLFNSLKWKRRSYVDFDDSIIYNNIAYRDDSDDFREYDKAITVFAFPSIQNRNQILVSEDSLISGLRRVSFDKAYNVGSQSNLLAYLSSTHINYDLIYSFETQRLPPAFLQEKDWTKIRYEFYSNSYTIFVEHLPRQVPSVPTSYSLAQDSPEIWSGRITATSGHSVVVDNLRSTSPNISDATLNDFVELPMEGVDPSNVGDKVVFLVTNNTIFPLSYSSAYDAYADDLITHPMHNGIVVQGIKHSIPGLSMACPDSAIATGREEIYDYTFDSYTLNSLAEDLDTFTYPLELPESDNQKWFFKVPDYRYWVYVRFRLKATQEELLEFIREKDEHDFGDLYNEHLAEIWFKNMQYLGIYFTFTQSPYSLNWSWQYEKPSNTYSSSSMNGYIRTPEIVTGQFSILGVGVSSWPDPPSSFPIFRGDPNTGSSGPANYGSSISENSLALRKSSTVQILASRYINNHLHTFGGEIDLIQ